MAAFFIADLHLSVVCPELVHAFEKFADELKDGDELYILGDLFNYFIGIDEHDQAQVAVKQSLESARARGVTTYFVHGNRDFLINKADALKLNMTLLEDHVLINKSNTLILATHGDSFCTNDLAYQKYAKTVSNPLYQFIFRCLPMSLRRNIGQRIRNKSKEMNYQRRDPNIYGIVVASVTKTFISKLNIFNQKHQISSEAGQINPPQKIVVHGHIHEFSQFNHESVAYDTRYVLGAWGKNYSYLKLDDNGDISFVEMPLNLLI